MSQPFADVVPSFLHSDRRLARAAQPIVRFLHVEAAGGILLVVATVAALVWANSPWQASYEALWSTRIRIEVGSYVFDEDLVHVINDLLMAVFFFVVGMEIKRELVIGELRDRRAVALPAMAAFGGMLVPALIYLAFNSGGSGRERLGYPDGHRHRLRARGCRPARQPSSVVDQGAAADVGNRRRHRRHRRDRRVLQRRSPTRVPPRRVRSDDSARCDASGSGDLLAAVRDRRFRAVADGVRVGCPRHDRWGRDGPVDSRHAAADRPRGGTRSSTCSRTDPICEPTTFAKQRP